jgi:hypothetical protein
MSSVRSRSPAPGLSPSPTGRFLQSVLRQRTRTVPYRDRGDASANAGSRSSIRIAHRLDHACSRPQCQQRDWNWRLLGRASNAGRSIRSPVETCFPVGGHMMAMMGKSTNSDHGCSGLGMSGGAIEEDKGHANAGLAPLEWPRPAAVAKGEVPDTLQTRSAVFPRQQRTRPRRTSSLT